MTLLDNLKRMKELGWEFEESSWIGNHNKEHGELYPLSNKFSPLGSVRYYVIPSILEVEDKIVKMGKDKKYEFHTNHCENWWYGINVINDEEGFCRHCYAVEDYLCTSKHPDRLTAVTSMWIKIKELTLV